MLAASATRLSDRPASSPRATPATFTSSTSSADRFPPGQVLGDRYRIVRKLGRGGMGEVYLADDLKLTQPVALKFLPQSLEADATKLSQLQNEVRLARQVSHPNVCRVYDLAEAGGVHFLTMEYVDGEDLSSLQRRIGRLPEDRATSVARQISAGLAAAHSRGVLHRDLKPANVMMDADGLVRITDFGLAAVGGTIADGFAGTPAYMAPEQLAGRAATEKSDIFALGLVLYELFTGKRAFQARTIDELRTQHDERRFATPAEVVPGLHPAIDRVIQQCLDPDPRQRPATPLAVAAGLPGGDPLAAALAAGETPSPELVAASGGEAATLTPLQGVLLVAGTIAVLVSCLVLADRYRLTALVPLDLSMPALEDRARTFESRLGLGDGAIDRATGMQQSGDLLNWLRAHPSGSATAAPYAAVQPSPMFFWYRSSPRLLVPTDDAQSRPSTQNPPLSVSGMTVVALDMRGRLVEFLNVPPQVESADAAPAAPVDWAPFFDAAGFDRSRFADAPPQWTPRVYADARAAWIGTSAALPDVPLRIEAASHRGRPVNFQIIGPWTRPTRMQAPPTNTVGDLVGFVASALVVPAFLVGGILLARRNLRRGRGDRRGAIRLGAVLTALLLAKWVIGASHFPDIGIEQTRFGVALSGALYAAAVMALLYLAIEPQVRRTHPAMLVTWSRLVGGRVRDPQLGRDLVIGALAGSAMSLISFLPHLLPPSFGWQPFLPPNVDLQTLRGLGAALAVAVGSLAFALQNSFLGAVGVVLVRLIVRQPVAAFVLTIVAFAPLAAAGQIATERLWLDLLFGGALVLIVLGVITRWGIVAGAVSFFVHFLTWTFPMTLDASRFFFPTSVSVLVTVAGLAVAGVVLARAREPLLGRLIND